MNKLVFSILYFCIIQISLANQADSLSLIHIGDSCVQAIYSDTGNMHQLSGAGSDIWSNTDDFDFGCISLADDQQITARLTHFNEVDSISKAGIMIRNSLEEGSVNAHLYYSIPYLGFDYREIRRGSYRRNKVTFTRQLPVWIRLIRKGDTIVSQRSENGQIWHTVEIKDLSLEDTVYFGLTVCSHAPCTLSNAIFDNVEIEKFDEEFTNEMLNSIIKHQVIHSNSVNDSFEINVGLPLSYSDTDTTSYPVTYFLDGDNDYDHYMLRNLMTDTLIPEIITVGIGYPGIDMRERDYLGGFPDFYLFMRDEVLPLIDENYKTKPGNRTLYGYSHGGSCSVQTLFKYGTDMPFQNIIAGSPSLWWPDGVFMFDREQELSEHTNTLAVNFYMTMGSDEREAMTYNFARMSEILSTRNYQYFNLETVLNIGYNHASNKELSFRQGHLWILNQPLPPAIPNDFITNSIIYKTLEEKENLVVYPNPAQNIVQIVYSELGQKNVYYEIFDFVGKIQQQGILCNNIINIETLNKGIYILSLDIPGLTIRNKIIVE